MKGYYMTFRCRLCGKTFTNGGTGDKETAWTATANAAFTASGIGPLKKLENKFSEHGNVTHWMYYPAAPKD